MYINNPGHIPMIAVIFCTVNVLPDSGERLLPIELLVCFSLL